MKLFGVYVREVPNNYSIKTPQAIVVNPTRHMEILEEEQKDSLEFIDYMSMSWKFKNEENTYVLRALNPSYLYLDYDNAKIEL